MRWFSYISHCYGQKEKKRRKFIDFILLYICSRKFGFRWWKMLLWWVFHLKDACNQINLFELVHSIKISDSMFHCHLHFICVYFDLMIYFYRLTFTRFIFRLHFNRKTFTLNSMYHMLCDNYLKKNLQIDFRFYSLEP